MYYFAEQFIHFQGVGCRRCEDLGEDHYCVTEGQTSASRMAEGNSTEGDLKLYIFLPDAFSRSKSRGRYHLYFAPLVVTTKNAIRKQLDKLITIDNFWLNFINCIDQLVELSLILCCQCYQFFGFIIPQQRLHVLLTQINNKNCFFVSKPMLSLSSIFLCLPCSLFERIWNFP